ncbi:lipase 1 isoform X2 [Leptinotarsa decemlineata]|uniref:lipase 1 isoform X2 n=1 Tax=Leptinotarsa decemlineata TaxID=7539 RepID=UPI003D305EE2
MELGAAGLLWLSSFISLVNTIKVCNSLDDYSVFNIFERNCFDNPVVNQNISEIIRSWPGFSAEEHYLITEDGYRILVERSFSKITQETPIIIVHGIAMSALGWVNRGNISLARLLGDLGYDVWMLNYRGSWYSKNHIILKPTDSNFWKFNINHLGVYDVRSTVRMVNEITNRQSIYIGYSMGATGFFIYSSTYPEEAKRYVKGIITLAPVINYKDVKSILKLSRYFWPFARLNFPQAMTQMLDTVGVELYTHYYQFYLTGEFRNYDYDIEGNMEVYGQPYPPTYNLTQIPVPMSIFLGANDWLATETNGKQIYSEIQPSLRCGYDVVPFRKWSHLDFLIAKDLPKYLYKYMFNKIKEIDSGKCSP